MSRLVVDAPTAVQESLQWERPRPQVRSYDAGGIVARTCGSVHCAILQCVAEVDQPTTEVALVGRRDLLLSSGIRVQEPKYEPGNLIVDAGQLGDEYQLVMPVRSGHRFFTPRT